MRSYRSINRLSQEWLADLLGYDKTYISMIETRRRTIGDIGTRRHIARTLGLPAHLLGVTDGTDDAGFAAMLQFGDSTIRLAEVARKAGYAVDAVRRRRRRPPRRPHRRRTPPATPPDSTQHPGG